ncbi:MAG TPA: hemolysin family protein [Solirubrobacteraceae bacterium]|nr:hemolysin family protein [Solirubrobacteraceae bacterium]
MSVLLLIALAALVAMNGFFVAAEFALVRVRRSKIEELDREGVSGTGRVLSQLDDISAYLSACQLGITMASLGIGFLGEPAVARLVEPVLGDVMSHAVAVTVAIAFAYVATTAAHITLGEQVPKIYAIVNAERMVRTVSGPLQLFYVVMRPFIQVLNATSNAMLRVLGIRPDIAAEEAETPEEIKAIIAQSYAGGHLDPGEAGMLSGVFHLHEQDVRRVMTPIPAVVTVDISEDVKTALRRCTEAGHTRLVVTEEHNRDRVLGLVHAITLARELMSKGPEAPLEPLIMDAPIVPETKPLDDLLAQLQRLRAGMAVVVDEYGRVAGIVTVEDIIEEVVGEIEDETDPRGGDIRRLANGDWFVRGHVPVTDLHDYGLSLPADSESYNSVGGLVFTRLGRLPRRGETVSADGFSIRVESVRENRVETVRIRERRPVGDASGA